MSIRNLEHLFRPKSIALIGASDRAGSVGATVMRNLVSGGFAGSVTPVNPGHRRVRGVRAYRDVASLPAAPDLGVICTPPATVPGLVAELGRLGTKAAVILTAGLSSGRDSDGRSLQQAALDAAKPHLLRILGPNCVGLLVPGIGLNASFAHTDAAAGDIAFVSQSGALTTAMLDWAKSKGIGFSHFISLGDSADVDFGDVLDYLAGDPSTRSILLYIESIKAARKFMSAARAAARNKPVIVVKAGRDAEGAKAAASHTGALAGSDRVFDAAIRRAGMLRVDTTLDLFGAVETLARAKPLSGDRLVILTNGGGPGVMATDALTLRGARPATLSAETLRQLDAILPPTWSRANPVDIIGDAPVERYVQSLRILLDDPDAHTVLLIHAPTAIVASDKIAAACAPLAKQTRRNVLGCWLGGDAVASARRIFADAGVPAYETPEEAVRAFLQMVNYRRNQEMLMEVPVSTLIELTPATADARAVVAGALAAGRAMLNEAETKSVLAAYGIPVVATAIAATAEDAVRMSDDLGYPVVLKVLSPDVSHKSEVGGIALNLENAQEVRRAADDIATRLQKLRPGATLAGYTVQRMMRRPDGMAGTAAHELIVGAATDPLFGPVILFGHGGTAVEVIGDRAVALPPLNLALARELVSRTRVSRLLAGYRNRPPADLNAILLTLTQVSQLVSDIPEIAELDINPLLADDKGVIALDARMRIAPAVVAGTGRLAIRPYPKELEETFEQDGRRFVMRPIRPEDEAGLRDLLARLDAEDLRFRFFYSVRELPHSALARHTQIDYDREMVFVATTARDDGSHEIVGEVQALADPDNACAEFAVAVRSDLKGRKIGYRLLEKTIRYCRERGTTCLRGQVLGNNKRMLALAGNLGFALDASGGDSLVEARLQLQAS